jgi:hypothetical protein
MKAVRDALICVLVIYMMIAFYDQFTMGLSYLQLALTQ